MKRHNINCNMKFLSKFCKTTILFELMKSKIAFFGKNQFLMGMLGEF